MLSEEPYPILEFDPERKALLEPRARTGRQPSPSAVVLCFFREVIEAVCGGGVAEEATAFEWEHGIHPLYSLDTEHGRVGVLLPGVGAPMAAGMMEAAVASGARHFVACGGAGAIRPGLALGHVVVPTAAMPPSR